MIKKHDGDTKMGYIFHNENPKNILTGDCVIRAIALITGSSWQDIYNEICIQGAKAADMPSSNRVWISSLKENGFKMKLLPETCPGCYTIKDFCEDYPKGKYLVGTGSHLVAVISGDYYDTWDSGDLSPIFYFVLEDE